MKPIVLSLYSIGLTLVICIAEKVKISNDNNEETMERYLFYEYNFWSQTQIYNKRTKLNESIIEMINATYSYHILHYDSSGKILARYQFLKCINGPCDYDMPDVYVNFIQGGNNLEGVYITTATLSKINWNILFAIIYTIISPAKNGAGDEQNVITPSGLCHYRFSKIHDKIFRRQINNCQFDGIRNFTSIDELTQHNYQHSVVYMQNTKSNADIVDIEAEEKMILKSSIIPDWNLNMKTQIKIKMTNRTIFSAKSFCPTKLFADECAQVVFKAKLMGKNWKEIAQKLNIGVKKEQSKLRSILQKGNNEFPAKNVDILALIVNSILFVTDQDLLDAIKEFRNTPIMPIFVDAIGLAGTKKSYNVGKNAFTTEAPEFLERFLQALSQTTKIDIVIINDLKAWMKNVNDKYYEKHLAFTIANLYRRYCNAMKSRKYECENGKNEDINEFTEYIITRCQNSNCHIDALQIFQNLPLLCLLPYAWQFLCSTSNDTNLVQGEALRFLQLFDGKHFHWKTINKLLRIFRNTCPLRQIVADQMLAIEVLLNILPDTELVGTHLLRSEELFPIEQEKWAYFYKSIARKRQISPDFNSYWTKMRSFRVFQPNYAHRSLKATSDVSTINIAELGDNNNITVWIKTANDKGILSWNDFSILFTSKKQSSFPLMQIFVEMKGMKSYLSDSESYDNDDDNDFENQNPLAIAQIGLLNNRNVPTTIFDGYNELINVVWNADGQSMLLYDKNLIYRQYYGYVPLMSGMSITVDIMGTVSIALYGSTKISLWNKDARMIINSTISTKLNGSISLASSNNLIGKATTLLYTNGTVDIRFDVDFSTVPHLFCIIVSHSPSNIRYSYTYGTRRIGNEKQFWHDIKLYGFSLWLNKKISDHCSLLNEK
ncbi:Microsomal triglyceride transfer protein [Dirofilaria immitis]